MKNATKTAPISEHILTHTEMMAARAEGWVYAQAQLAEVLERFASKFEKAQTTFNERFAVNPADAITWSAEAVVTAQQLYTQALQVHTALLKQATSITSALELLTTWRAEATDSFLRTFRIGASTCPWSNAVENAKTTATKDALNGYAGPFVEFTAVLKHFDKHCEADYAKRFVAQAAA